MNYRTCASCGWGPDDERPPVCPRCGRSLVETRSLDGQVAVVTGGGTGIGRAIATALTEAGAAVAVTGRRVDRLRRVVDDGDAALAVRMDVADSASVAGGFDRVRAELGVVDLLVNCAGTSGPSTLLPWELDEDDWWEVLEVNLRGPQLCASAVLPAMIDRRRGRVVNIGSGVGLSDEPAEASAYGASKAALHHLTGTLARAAAAGGVTVIAFSPGLVRTPMTEDIAMFDDVPAAAWSPAEASGDLTVRIALGDLDALAGRLVSVRQPLDALLARTDEIVADGLMTVRYRDVPWAPWDGA